jgi:DNA-binding transcriptional regulator YbjK
MTVRRARGEQRRRAILEGSLRVVGERGAGRLTHRAAAAEAQVPLAATTYYFASREDLLLETLRLAARREIESSESDPHWQAAEAAGSASELALALADGVAAYVEQRREALALYELFLMAGREPALAAEAEAWTAAAADMLEPVLARLGSSSPATDARAVTALLDGLGLEQLAGPRDDFCDDVVRPALLRVLTALLPTPVPTTNGARP